MNVEMTQSIWMFLCRFHESWLLKNLRLSTKHKKVTQSTKAQFWALFCDKISQNAPLIGAVEPNDRKASGSSLKFTQTAVQSTKWTNGGRKFSTWRGQIVRRDRHFPVFTVQWDWRTGRHSHNHQLSPALHRRKCGNRRAAGLHRPSGQNWRSVIAQRARLSHWGRPQRHEKPPVRPQSGESWSTDNVQSTEDLCVPTEFQTEGVCLLQFGGFRAKWLESLQSGCRVYANFGKWFLSNFITKFYLLLLISGTLQPRLGDFDRLEPGLQILWHLSFGFGDSKRESCLPRRPQIRGCLSFTRAIASSNMATSVGRYFGSVRSALDWSEKPT